MEQQEKEEHGGGNEELERRSPAHPHGMGSGGAFFRDAQNTCAVIYLPKPCLHCNLRCIPKSSFKPSLKHFLLKMLPVCSDSQSPSRLEKAASL